MSGSNPHLMSKLSVLNCPTIKNVFQNRANQLPGFDAINYKTQ